MILDGYSHGVFQIFKYTLDTPTFETDGLAARTAGKMMVVGGEGVAQFDLALKAVPDPVDDAYGLVQFECPVHADLIYIASPIYYLGVTQRLGSVGKY